MNLFELSIIIVLLCLGISRIFFILVRSRADCRLWIISYFQFVSLCNVFCWFILLCIVTSKRRKLTELYRWLNGPYLSLQIHTTCLTWLVIYWCEELMEIFNAEGSIQCCLKNTWHIDYFLKVSIFIIIFCCRHFLMSYQIDFFFN